MTMRWGCTTAGVLLWLLILVQTADAHTSWLVREFRNFSAYPRIHKAYDEFNRGDYQKARNLLESATRIDPDNTEAHKALAETCFKLKDLSCAKRQGKALNRLSPKSPEGYFILARIANLEHRHDDASVFAEKALNLRGLTHTQRNQLVQLLGENLIKAGNIEKAEKGVQLLAKTKANGDQLKTAYDRLIDLCFVENRIAKGSKWYQTYTQTFGPPEPQTALYWSNLMAQHGHTQLAYQMIEELPSRGVILTHKVNLLEKLGQYQKAADLFSKNATSAEKAQARYWQRVATLYQKAGDTKREFEIIARGIRSVKENRPLYRMAINRLIHLKAYNRAIGFLKEELKEHKSDQSVLELARLYEKEDQYDKAVRELYPLWEKIKEDKTSQPNLTQQLLYLLEKQRDWNPYLRVMLHELRSKQSSGDKKMGLTIPDTFFTRHHLKQKIEALEGAYPFSDIPKDYRFEFIINLIHLERMAQNIARAKEMVRELAKWPSLDLEQLNRLAVLANELNMCHLAIDLARLVIAKSPQSAHARLIAGYCAQKEGRIEEAIGFLNEAAKLRPSVMTRRFHIGLGTLYAEVGEDQKALAQWKIALERQFDPKLALKIARCYYDQNDMTSAEELLSSIDPTSLPRKKRGELWALKGRVAEHQGDLKKAVKAYRKSLSAWETAHIWAQLGYTYIRQQKKPAAVRAFQEAVLLSPDTGSYRASLAYLLSETGEPEEAAKAFKAAIRLDPENISLYKGLGYTEMKTGNYRAAANAFKHVVDYYADHPDIADAKTADEIYRIKKTLDDIDQRWHFDFAEVVRLDNSHFEPQQSLVPYSSYSGFGMLSGDYRILQGLGPLNSEISAFGRFLWTNKNRSLAVEKDLSQAGVGLSVKPLSDYNVLFSMERMFKVGSDTQNDWMIRAGASFDEGTYWHPAADAWAYYDIYLDAAYLIDSGQHYLTSNVRWGRAYKVRDAWALVPFLTGGAVDSNGNTWIDAGAGVTLAIWGFENRQHAHRLETRITLEGRQQLAGNSPDEHTVRLTYEMHF